MNQSLKDKVGFLLAAIFALGFGYFSPSLAQTDVSRTKLFAKYVADSIGVSDGTGVVQWNNLQGTASRNLRQSTSAARPTLKTNIVNGHSVVRFDGVQTFMDTSTAGLNLGEAEVYVVIKANADPASSSTTNGFWYFMASSTPLTQSAHYPHTSGDIYETFRRNTSRVNVNPTPSLSSAFRLYSVHADTNKYTMRIDTTTIFNDASAYTLDQTAGAYRIGKSSNGTSFFAGDIAELRVYRPKLTNSQRDTLYYYFDTRYTLAYTPPVINPQEMDVKGNNTSIADGDATPSATDSTDFGNVVTVGVTRKVTYKIFNTGSSTLTISGTPKVAVAGTHAADFTVTTQPAATIAAGDSSSFVVEFDPSATGVRSATLSIANDDANENPYNWSIQGTGVTREIAVKGNNTDIADGSTSASTADFTNFGTVAPITGTVSRTFKIFNSGTSNLTLSGSPKVALTGDASFSVTSQPSSPVAGGDSTSFVILFAPQTVGSKTATVSITNDDTDENPFDFVISGLAVSSDDGAYFTRFDTLSVTLSGAGAKDTLWVTPSLDGRMTLSTSSPAKIPGRTVSFPKKLTIWTDRLSGSGNSFKAYWLPINPLTGALSKNDSTYVIGTSGAAASLVSGTSYALTLSSNRGLGIVVSQVSSGTNVIRFNLESSQ